jgi:heparanase 1
MSMLVLAGLSAIAASSVFTIDTAHVVARVDPAFLSVTMDGHTFDGANESFWRPNSKLTRVLAGALQPAYIRFGGNSHSLLTYDMTSASCEPQPDPLPQPQKYTPPKPNTCMSATQWDEINRFTKAVGWHSVFALNALLRKADKSDGGSWDPTAAEAFLKYNMERNYSVDIELGNEPDLFHYAYKIPDRSVMPVPPAQLLQDHLALNTLIEIVYAESGQQRPQVTGPDVANAGPTGGARYWSEYFGNHSVSSGPGISRASWHHYYGSGKTATVADTYSPTTLDKLVVQQQQMASILEEKLGPSANVPIWLGETSSFYGGGAVNISDRYGAGFTWLDKLAVAARLNVSVVCRQAWMGGAYSLIEYTTFVPLSDYYVSVLHKRLVGQKVLAVTDGLTMGRRTRVYAQCTSSTSGYPAGSVTLIVLNTNNSTAATIQVKDATSTATEDSNALLSSKWDAYLLTPAEGGSAVAGLSSKSVALNGKALAMGIDPTSGDPALPAMAAVAGEGAITVPPLTFGFFVLKDAGAVACH